MEPHVPSHLVPARTVGAPTRSFETTSKRSAGTANSTKAKGEAHAASYATFFDVPNEAPWVDRPLLGLLARGRVQLALAFAVGALLPAMLRWPTSGLIPNFAGLDVRDGASMISLVGSGIAITLGCLTLRQLKTHPGVNSIGYVLYAFSLTFAALSVLLLFTRGEYARYQLGLSFILTLVTQMLVQRWLVRNKRLRLALVPSEGMPALPRQATLCWSTLAGPDDNLSGLDGVVADLRATHSPAWERMMVGCSLSGLPVFDVRRIVEQLTGKVVMTHPSENTLGVTLYGLVYAKMKRAIDLLIALYVLPPFIFALAVAAIAIKLDDGGPVVFRQTRMGYRGKPFVIYKLRTMRTESQGDHFTLDRDPRITRVGGFLRKYRVDEFPQIWNILCGDMGWIGPRPEALPLSDSYEAEIPFYRYRYLVRPGITGWAQVNQGNVSDINAINEKLNYDFYYIKYLSPWLDILITAKTVMTILTGFGSR